MHVFNVMKPLTLTTQLNEYHNFCNSLLTITATIHACMFYMCKTHIIMSYE